MGSEFKKIRVFLCTPFRDMHAERAYLHDVVFPRVSLQYQKQGHVFELVDPRRRAQTEEEAEGPATLEKSLDDVENCRPYFLGILGANYGKVILEVPDAVGRKYPGIKHYFRCSRMHLETLHGVLRDPRRAKDSVFFYRKPDFLGEVSEADRGIYLPNNSQAAINEIEAHKLEVFKGAISAAGLTIVEYDCRWDASSRRVAGLEDFGEKVAGALLSLAGLVERPVERKATSLIGWATTPMPPLRTGRASPAVQEVEPLSAGEPLQVGLPFASSEEEVAEVIGVPVAEVPPQAPFELVEGIPVAAAEEAVSLAEPPAGYEEAAATVFSGELAAAPLPEVFEAAPLPEVFEAAPAVVDVAVPEEAADVFGLAEPLLSAEMPPASGAPADLFAAMDELPPVGDVPLFASDAAHAADVPLSAADEIFAAMDEAPIVAEASAEASENPALVFADTPQEPGVVAEADDIDIEAMLAEENAAAAPVDTPLESRAFLITAGDVEPPLAELNEEMLSFLATLKVGREKCVELRASSKRENPAAAFQEDPIDEALPDWHSLAILFDWEKMDAIYGKQALGAFLRRIDSEQLKGEVVLHFGDLFNSLCALVARAQDPADIAYVAAQFGPECELPGLLSSATRFLRADCNDGHLIPRSFSLPVEARLHDKQFEGDKRGGLGQFVQAEELEGTSWQLA